MSLQEFWKYGKWVIIALVVLAASLIMLFSIEDIMIGWKIALMTISAIAFIILWCQSKQLPNHMLNQSFD